MSEAVKPLLIFDFDGTIANTIDTGIGIFNDVAPDYGLEPVTDHDIAELRKLNIRAVLNKFGISKLTAVKLATRIRKEIHDRMDEVEMFPGVSESVATLHDAGFRMGILSSNSTDNVREFVQRFNLSHCFEFIEAGVSLFGKSTRINQVLKKQSVKSRDALYIGDETRDMEAARKSEVSTVAVCWGANKKEAMMTEGPDYIIEDPHELVNCAKDYAARDPDDKHYKTIHEM